MMFLKVGSESQPFWGEQKEGEKRQKVDKNLELGGFFVGRKFSPKKTDLGNGGGETAKTRGILGVKLHHWSFTKNIDGCFRKLVGFPPKS